jgi:hypothetical protein
MSYVVDWFVLAILYSFLHFVLLEFLWATGPEAIVAREYGPSFLMAVLFAVVNCLQTFSISPDLSRRTSSIAKPLPLWSVLCLGKAADFNSCSDAYCSGTHKVAPSLTNRAITTPSGLDTRFVRATEHSRFVRVKQQT